MPREVLRVSLPVLAVGWGSALSRHTRENAQCLFKVPKQVLGGAENNTLLKILSQFFWTMKA